MSVTATRPEPYVAGDIRNGGQTGRSGALTDKGTAEYDSVPAAVTCAECGQDIPPNANMLVRRRYCEPVESICVPCVGKLIAKCRPNYCHHVPWEGPGVRGHRTSGEYQHWCDRCGRPFIGALARRYCSDDCGERTRNGRRDRTRDREPRQCAHCGDPFTPPRTDGRYCSGACRQKAYRTRKIGGVQ